MTLLVLPGEYCICRLNADSQTPDWIALQPDGPVDFVSITRTRDELSIVCLSHLPQPDVTRRSDGWRCLRMAGSLDLALTGILSSLLQPLADAACPVFTVATHNTDYLLVPGHELPRAVAALRAAGHVVHD